MRKTCKMYSKLRFKLSIFVPIFFSAACIWLEACTGSASDYICSTPCPLNAHCVEHKEQCVCNSGYYQNISEQNGLPVCRPLCLEDCVPPLICVRPNICNCPEGYLFEHLECKPQCSLGCRNGYCKAPEVCACYEGFRLTGNNTCEEDITVMSTVKLSTISVKRNNGIEDETPSSATTKEVEVISKRVHRPFVKQRHYVVKDTTKYTSDVSGGNLEGDAGMTTTVLPTADETVKLAIHLEKKCLNGSNYEEGACGPYTFCDYSGRCVCITGYSRQNNTSGVSSSMTCVREKETKERFLMVPSDGLESSCLKGFYIFVGMSCIAGALLSLFVYFYKHRK